MKLILLTILIIVSVSWALQPGWGQQWCEKDCDGNTKPVCLDGETVPYCYAKCKKKVIKHE